MSTEVSAHLQRCKCKKKTLASPFCLATKIADGVKPADSIHATYCRRTSRTVTNQVFEVIMLIVHAHLFDLSKSHVSFTMVKEMQHIGNVLEEQPVWSHG
jgi:hypothetical protein